MRDYASVQPLADKAAIGLSMLCAIHCLAVPVLVALLPAAASLGLDDERFHLWLVIVVLPVSAVALTLGCRKHRSKTVLFIGLAGLAVLCLASALGHDALGEAGEKMLTLTGAALIAVSHVKNFALCRVETDCESSH